MAVQQRASAKLCGAEQGMELRNFRRGRHLYSAGRPSRWASAHILVLYGLLLNSCKQSVLFLTGYIYRKTVSALMREGGDELCRPYTDVKYVRHLIRYE